MKQLRRLSEVTLQKSNKAKRANGTRQTAYEDIETYHVIAEEITDSIYASIYGSNLSKMLRISSPLTSLESFLKGKNTDGTDNLSLYFILVGNKRYKITAVMNNWVDIEFYETNRTV